MSGSTMPLLRMAQPNDRDAIGRFLASMDREGLYRRHFSAGEAPNIALLKRVDMLDHLGRVALVAVDGRGGVLAHGEYVADNGIAEFALMVLPLFRGQGIGTRLLRGLMVAAMNAGQRKMVGVVQAVNTQALRLILSNGFQTVPGEDRTTVVVSMKLGVESDPCLIKPKPDEPEPSKHHDTCAAHTRSNPWMSWPPSRHLQLLKIQR